MNSTLKGVLTVLVVAGIGYAAYNYLIRDKKAFYAKKIAEAGKHGNETALKTFEEAFLKEWYKGVKNNQESFTYQGKSYNTQGGRLKA